VRAAVAKQRQLLEHRKQGETVAKMLQQRQQQQQEKVGGQQDSDEDRVDGDLVPDLHSSKADSSSSGTGGWGDGTGSSSSSSRSSSSSGGLPFMSAELPDTSQLASIAAAAASLKYAPVDAMIGVDRFTPGRREYELRGKALQAVLDYKVGV
jgi:hypothetical protein